MLENARRSQVPWVVVTVLASVVAILAITSCSQTQTMEETPQGMPPSTPVPQPTEITIGGDSASCYADPTDPQAGPGSEICFLNSLKERVYLEFLKPEFIEGNIISIFVDPGKPECITIKESILGTPPYELPYIIMDAKQEKCSEDTGPNRPRIIIP